MGVTLFQPGARLIIPGVQVMQTSGAAAAVTGILDSITSAAAYSLRQLRTAYAGSAVRFRRSSDSTEQDIGFVAGEFDSASYSAFVGGGSGFVKTWYDQSGNGRNLAQATTTKQPLLILSGQNSKPVLRFDGSDDFLFYAHGSTVSQPFSSLTAAKATTTGSVNFLDAYAGVRVLLRPASTTTTQIFAGTLLTLTHDPRNFSVFSAIFNGLTSALYGNGGTGVSGQAGATGWNGITLGARSNGDAGEFASCDIAEHIFMTGAISQANHNTIGSNQATRFGLTWTNV